MFAKTMKIVIVAITSLSLLAAIGCASRQSSEYYQRGQTQKMQTVLLGEVVSVRSVTIEGTKTPAGTVVGMLMGGVIGSMIGGGKGSTLTTIVGATAGGMGGSKVEEEVTRKPGYELTITLDNGETVAIVQEADVSFVPGDRVRIVKNPDGMARVSHL